MIEPLPPPVHNYDVTGHRNTHYISNFESLCSRTLLSIKNETICHSQFVVPVYTPPLRSRLHSCMMFDFSPEINPLPGNKILHDSGQGTRLA